MAKRRDNRDSFVPWDQLRRVWGRESQHVQQFFDRFYQTHRNYQFTVAKNFFGLYEVGITCEQYDEVKDEVKRQTGEIMTDIKCTELLDNGDHKCLKTFRGEREYISYKSKFVQPNNKRIVRETSSKVKAHFNEAQKCFKEAQGNLILSFDLEAYEYDHDKILEIGYIVVRLGSGAPQVTERCHFIIQENMSYKNKDFVPDNRHGFRFGKSQIVPQEEAVETFRQAVENSAFLVAHAARNDESYFKRIGVDLDVLKKGIMDTQMIQQHKEFVAKGVGNRIYLTGLKTLLTEYNVVYREADLHNAGCDAYYTVMVFLRQMGYSASVVNALS